jgi:hypothetical protein
VSEEQGICRGDHPALLLVEQWKDRCLFRWEIVLAYHTRVVHNIRPDGSNDFLTGPKAKTAVEEVAVKAATRVMIEALRQAQGGTI